MQRRSFLRGVGIAAAASAVVTPNVVMAAAPKGPNNLGFDAAVKAITGGKKAVASSKVKLKAPEIAENGAVVPITVTVDSPMTDSDYIKAIHVLASKNGNVRCADVMLTPASGAAMFAARIKLGTSQDVVAIVETSKGEFLTASQNVKVTIGGCG